MGHSLSTNDTTVISKNAELVEAAWRGDVKIVSNLLRRNHHHAESSISTSGCLQLGQASSHQTTIPPIDINAIRVKTVQDDDGYMIKQDFTALTAASFNGQHRVVATLLESGADLFKLCMSTSSSSSSGSIWSAGRMRPEQFDMHASSCLRCTLQHSHSIHKSAAHKCWQLILAHVRDNLSVEAQRLFACEASMLLSFACTQPDSSDWIRALLDAFPDLVDVNSWSAPYTRHAVGALHTACQYERVDYLRLLTRADLRIRADVRATDSKGRTPLHYALQNQSPDCLQLLLQLQDDDEDGIHTAHIHFNALALHLIKTGKYAAAGLLFRWPTEPARPDGMDEQGTTPMIWLAGTARHHMLTYFRTRGDMDDIPAERTVWMQQALSELGILNRQQSTDYHHDLDQHQPHHDHEQPLAQFADIDWQDRRGRTALMLAAADGLIDLVRELAVNVWPPPNIELRDNEDRTAMDFVSSNAIRMDAEVQSEMQHLLEFAAQRYARVYGV